MRQVSRAVRLLSSISTRCTSNKSSASRLSAIYLKAKWHTTGEFYPLSSICISFSYYRVNMHANEICASQNQHNVQVDALIMCLPTCKVLKTTTTTMKKKMQFCDFLRSSLERATEILWLYANNLLFIMQFNCDKHRSYAIEIMQIAYTIDINYYWMRCWMTNSKIASNLAFWFLWKF
jgi:hypothetical protein